MGPENRSEPSRSDCRSDFFFWFNSGSDQARASSEAIRSGSYNKICPFETSASKAVYEHEQFVNDHVRVFVRAKEYLTNTKTFSFFYVRECTWTVRGQSFLLATNTLTQNSNLNWGKMLKMSIFDIPERFHTNPVLFHCWSYEQYKC